MEAKGVALFDTAIGRCGIAWGPRGVVGVQLPASGDHETGARLIRRFPGARETAFPPRVAEVVAAMACLLRGEPADLGFANLDMDGLPTFDRKVYAVAREIPVGETLTYGEIARGLGDPTAAREVGRALGDNPFPIIVPCHRVLGAGGKAGGFSAHGGSPPRRGCFQSKAPGRAEPPCCSRPCRLLSAPTGGDLRSAWGSG